MTLIARLRWAKKRTIPPSPPLPPFLGIIDKDGLIRSALSAEPLARRMTMEVDNNGGRKRTLARRGGRRLERIEARKEEKEVNLEG